MTTNKTPISFTKTLLSGTVHTLHAGDYEQLCKFQKNCFEIIPDEGYIKPYFDVDYTIKEGDNMDNEEDYIQQSSIFLSLILSHLWEYFSTEAEIGPDFSIAMAHKPTKMSFHINITNINTTKESILGYIQEINERVKHLEGLTDADNKPYRINTYLQFGSDENLFDVNVYKQKGKEQKMRSVHCVKDDEPDRPFQIIPKQIFDENDALQEIYMSQYCIKDSFEDMLISVTNPDNIVYVPQENCKNTNTV